MAYLQLFVLGTIFYYYKFIDMFVLHNSNITGRLNVESNSMPYHSQLIYTKFGIHFSKYFFLTYVNIFLPFFLQNFICEKDYNMFILLGNFLIFKFYFYCLLVYYVHQIPQINEIMWYISFSDCLNSLSIIFSSPIHAVVKCRSSLFFNAL